jgi:hypothetical protein
VEEIFHFWKPGRLDIKASMEIFQSIFLKVWFDCCQRSIWGEKRLIVLNFLVCGGPCGFCLTRTAIRFQLEACQVGVTQCVSLHFTKQFREIHRPTSACLSPAEMDRSPDIFEYGHHWKVTAGP